MTVIYVPAKYETDPREVRRGQSAPAAKLAKAQAEVAASKIDDDFTRVATNKAELISALATHENANTSLIVLDASRFEDLHHSLEQLDITDTKDIPIIVVSKDNIDGPSAVEAWSTNSRNKNLNIIGYMSTEDQNTPVFYKAVQGALDRIKDRGAKEIWPAIFSKLLDETRRNNSKDSDENRQYLKEISGRIPTSSGPAVKRWSPKGYN